MSPRVTFRVSSNGLKDLLAETAERLLIAEGAGEGMKLNVCTPKMTSAAGSPGLLGHCTGAL